MSRNENDQNSDSLLESLPHEAFMALFQYLSDREILNLGLGNKELHSYTEDAINRRYYQKIREEFFEIEGNNEILPKKYFEGYDYRKEYSSLKNEQHLFKANKDNFLVTLTSDYAPSPEYYVSFFYLENKKLKDSELQSKTVHPWFLFKEILSKLNDTDNKYFVDLMLAMQTQIDSEYSFLTFAAAENDVEQIKQLLDLGIDVNEPDPSGKTALYRATSSIEQDCVQLLLERGADLNAKINLKNPFSDQLDKIALELVLNSFFGRNGELISSGKVTPFERFLSCIKLYLNHNLNLEILAACIEHSERNNLYEYVLLFKVVLAIKIVDVDDDVALSNDSNTNLTLFSNVPFESDSARLLREAKEYMESKEGPLLINGARIVSEVCDENGNVLKRVIKQERLLETFDSYIKEIISDPKALPWMSLDQLDMLMNDKTVLSIEGIQEVIAKASGKEEDLSNDNSFNDCRSLP